MTRKKKSISVVFSVVAGKIGEQYFNQKLFADKKGAIENITMLFNRCYPDGFDLDGNMVCSPKYDDHECHLVQFYTNAGFYYSMHELEVN